MLTSFLDHVTANSAAPVGQFIRDNIAVVEIMSMFAIGAYNSLEAGIATFDCFKHYHGVYFWSMQVASWGTFLHTIMGQISYLTPVPILPISIPFMLGWICMVTGQAIVLYSRLHLIVADTRSLRWVLGMIITNAILLHLPMIVLFYCSLFGSTASILPAHIFGHIQVIGFCIQDFIIGGIYIHESLRAFKPVLEVRGREGRRVIYHLIFVNFLVVILDVALLVTEFKAQHLEIAFDALFYSIKLKVEFMVLTHLRSLTRTYLCVCHDEENHPRRSSDINIFDMVSARSRTVNIESPPVFPVRQPSSIQTSTHDFHQVLREVASSENMMPSNGIRNLSPEVVNEKHDSRSRMGSADTRSTVEIALLDSPK